MEFQYSPSLLLIITPFLLLLLILVSMKYRKKLNARSEAKKVPPGPWKLPLIGNLHQLAVAGASSLPHHVLRDLSLKYGALMHLQLGEISTVVVSSPDMAKQIMNTHDLAFSQRPQLLTPKILAYDSTDIAFAPYGHYWRQMRKICTLELLSTKRVQSFSSIRQHEVTKLIQSIQQSSSPINISALLFSLVITLVSREAFGIKSEHEDELLSLVKKASETMGGFDLADLFPSLKHIHLITGMKAKLEDMHKKLDNILDKIVKEHQENISHDHKGEENLIDVLLRLQQSSNLEVPITVNNIKAVIWDIFGGGTDTSATVLEWTMSELMKNPRVMEKAQNEIREAIKGKETIKESDLHKLSYLKAVIKESMRLHPPAPLLLPRECREACKIGGYDIAVKSKVIVNAWAIGRDPNRWYNADSFMPERFNNNNNNNGIGTRGNDFEYIPFGAGRRMCPGISLGLANVELPLAALLYHFDWKLPNGIQPQDLDITEAFGAAVQIERVTPPNQIEANSNLPQPEQNFIKLNRITTKKVGHKPTTKEKGKSKDKATPAIKAKGTTIHRSSAALQSPYVQVTTEELNKLK
ncbi:hypothetical protein PIB30_020273 [Stylosanthes scabra]|uniref:Uncharacterized protein n=1 Tax=Stylosanthes scabra TaxID=79078 RepID=A0ABU6U7F3_9FABA|nr:hypothetical protein [Stylosanthes scabra]